MNNRKRAFFTLMGDSISYLFRDLFNTDLAGGAVNGTAAEPGPGTRTVTDVSSKVSIASGLLTFSTSATALNGVWYDAQTRIFGKALIAKVIPTTARLYVGYGASTSGAPGVGGFLFRCATSVLNLFDTTETTLGAITPGATYYIAVVMRSAGLLYFIKGGAFTSWTLVWDSNFRNNASNLPMIINGDTTTVATSDYIKIMQLYSSLLSPVIADAFTRTVVPVYDAFTRADGAIGDAVVGGSWVQVAAGGGKVTAVITSNQLTAPDSGGAVTAAYSGIDLGSGNTPKRMTAKIIFSNANTGGVVGLISNPLGLTNENYITTSSVHIIFSDTKVAMGCYVNDVWTKVDYVYPTPCARDNATVYSIGWSLVGNTLTVEAPDGTTTTNTNSAYSQNIGRYCTFEHYWATGQTQPRFTEATIQPNFITQTTDIEGKSIDPAYYTARLGQWGTSSNKAICNVLSGGVGIITAPAGTNVCVEAEITRSGDNVGIVALYADASNYLYAYHDGTNAKLHKVTTAGGDEELITAAATYSAGKRLMLSIDGTAVRMYYNENLIGTQQTVSDAALLAAQEYGLYTTNAGNTFDNFMVWRRGTNGEYERLFNKYL